jgi:hypothetical protein
VPTGKDRVVPGEVSVLMGDRQFVVGPDRPLRFGRADRGGVVGLDPDDMGISTVAGSVRQEWGVWWLENHSRKRRLLLGDGSAVSLRGLECGRRTVILDRHLTVLVPGALHSHTVEIVTPITGTGGMGDRESSDAVGAQGLRLGERDKDVLVAVLADYLDAFPTRPPVPRTYQQAAELLGPPWTKRSVRKQIARLRGRVARVGPVFVGPQANYDMAAHLVVNSLLDPTDRNRIGRAR